MSVAPYFQVPDTLRGYSTACMHHLHGLLHQLAVPWSSLEPSGKAGGLQAPRAAIAADHASMLLREAFKALEHMHAMALTKGTEACLCVHTLVPFADVLRDTGDASRAFGGPQGSEDGVDHTLGDQLAQMQPWEDLRLVKRPAGESSWSMSTRPGPGNPQVTPCASLTLAEHPNLTQQCTQAHQHQRQQVQPVQYMHAQHINFPN